MASKANASTPSRIHFPRPPRARASPLPFSRVVHFGVLDANKKKRGEGRGKRTEKRRQFLSPRCFPGERSRDFVPLPNARGAEEEETTEVDAHVYSILSRGRPRVKQKDTELRDKQSGLPVYLSAGALAGKAKGKHGNFPGRRGGAKSVRASEDAEVRAALR